MPNLNSSKTWATMTAVVLVIAAILYFIQTNPVIVILGSGHTAEVWGRVWDEVLPQSRAGRAYRSLLSKHVFEFNRILKEHPEHVDETSKLIEMFLPVLEAQPGDRDDAARITAGQIDALQVELNWISSRASVSLRNDIEREQERFPLKNLAGMTLYEALDYADSNWSPVAAPLPSPTPVVRPTLPVLPTPACAVGKDPDCFAEPLLVSNSDGRWAYYMANIVYFEYSSDWRMENTQNTGTIYFLPPKDSPEELKTRGAFLTVRANARRDDFPPYENAIWVHQISLPGFEGYEFLIRDADTSMHTLNVFLYNEEHQLMIYSATAIQNDPQGQLTATREIAKENFPNFHHMIESFEIRVEMGFVKPTATVMENSPFVARSTLPPQEDGPWASEIIDGVYFEYPQEWKARQSEGQSILQIRYFIPAENSFEKLNTRATILGVAQPVSVPQDIPLGEIACSQEGPFQQPDSIWHQPLAIDDFEGSEFLWVNADGSMRYLEAVLYNRERQQMICVTTEILPGPNDPLSDTLEMTRKTFLNYHHILESIRFVE